MLFWCLQGIFFALFFATKQSLHHELIMNIYRIREETFQPIYTFENYQDMPESGLKFHYYLVLLK